MHRFPFRHRVLALLATLAFSMPAAESAAFDLDEAGTTQAVIVVTDGWNEIGATLLTAEREPGGTWTFQELTSPAVVGRAGLAWGLGLHPANAFETSTGSAKQKREGDGRAPAGIFAIGATAYGKAKGAPTSSKLAWIQSKDYVCVDDAASPQYNRVLFAKNKKGNYRSFERMRRKDALYDIVVVVDHNGGTGRTAAVPKAGSCIFLHIWRSAKKGTAGCTAMPRKNMAALFGTLDPNRSPTLIQLPRAEYKRRQTAWKLPPLPPVSKDKR